MEKIRPLLRRSLRAVDGDAIALNGLILCGVKGTPIVAMTTRRHWQRTARPNSTAWTLLLPLPRSSAEQRTDRRSLAFPPVRPEPPTRRVCRPLEAAGVKQVVYGHLHNQGQWASATQGTINGVRYDCVASDAIGFRPLRLANV